jgi:hypothetical protein
MCNPIDRLMNDKRCLFYEVTKMGMHTAKSKPLTKKEREAKRKKKRDKEAAR